MKRKQGETEGRADEEGEEVIRDRRRLGKGGGRREGGKLEEVLEMGFSRVEEGGGITGVGVKYRGITRKKDGDGEMKAG